MSTKTVSLKTEAYNRLKTARRYPGESFSEVVLRATWPEDTTSAGAFLALVRTKGMSLTPEEIDRMEEAKRLDMPAVDKWVEH
jgi:predicted CopG family antitoxin